MRIIFFANTDWYLYNFRLSLAKELRRQGSEVILISPPGDYGARLLAEGFQWIPVSMLRRSLNPFRELFLIWTLISLFRKKHPDLVHNFTIKCVIYGTIASIIAKVHGCINAVTGMGFIFSNHSLLARLLRPGVKFVLRLALKSHRSRLILQNPDDVNALISQNIVNREQVRLIRGSGVDTSKFQLRDNVIRNENNGVVFTVLLSTRLLWDKGVKEYIEAARIVQKGSSTPIEFWIAGSPDQGNPSSVPLLQVMTWQAEGTIKYLGHVEQMAELLSQVDLMVLPSYREGVPRILIEAAATGLPIVATDVPGCREIVRHKINGLLIPVKNSTALAEAINYFVRNPLEMIAMGKEGRKIAVEEFDEELVIRNTLSVYRELINI